MFGFACNSQTNSNQNETNLNNSIADLVFNSSLERIDYGNSIRLISGSFDNSDNFSNEGYFAVSMKENYGNPIVAYYNMSYWKSSKSYYVDEIEINSEEYTYALQNDLNIDAINKQLDTLWNNLETETIFNAIIEVSSQFKDPFSVRILSGTIINERYGGWTIYCAISAKNGFGGRKTEYYEIEKLSFSNSFDLSELNALSSSYSEKYQCANRNDIDTTTINDRLVEKWGDY